MPDNDKRYLPQATRFKEATCQLEVDGSEATFDEKLKTIVEQKAAPTRGVARKSGERIGREAFLDPGC